MAGARGILFRQAGRQAGRQANRARRDWRTAKRNTANTGRHGMPGDGRACLFLLRMTREGAG